jgi:hypothetical protein
MTAARMTNAEAVLLCRFAKACCPQQQFDQYTPDAWFELLSDLRFEDCKEALTAVVKRQPFVSPAEIREEVRRVRNKRVSDFGVIPDPPGDLMIDNPGEYQRYIYETTRAIADGDLQPGDVPPMTIGERDVVAELGTVGTSVDAALATRPLREAHAAARRDLQAAEAEKTAAHEARQADLERMRAADRAARTTPTPTTHPADERPAK